MSANLLMSRVCLIYNNMNHPIVGSTISVCKDAWFKCGNPGTTNQGISNSNLILN